MAAQYNKMSLGQLKAELSKRELDNSGKKSELVNKLVENDVELKRQEDEKKAEEERLAKEAAEAKKAEEAAKKAEEEAAKKLAEEAAAKKAEEEKSAELAKKAVEIKTEPNNDEDTSDKAKDASEIIDEIDSLIKNENGDVEMTENGNAEEKEEVKEEPKEVLKSESYDFTKNAQGYVIALDSGSQIVIPVKDTLKYDMKSRRQSKTVIVYPLRIEDITSGILQPFMEKCCHFYMNFHEFNHEREKSTKGFVEFIFSSDEEAEEQADLLAEVSEDLVVRKLSRKDKPQDTYQDVPQELITVGTMVKRYVYIGNLPSTATEEELQALFPDCINLAIILNDDGLPKGYAFAEFESEEKVNEVLKQSMKIRYPGFENKLVLMRNWAKIPKGLLDAPTRKDILDKIRNMRKIRMKASDDMMRRNLENEIALLKMKLDKDCRVRSDIGLPEPPDILRQAEARAAVAKREGDKPVGAKSGTSISTVQRGFKSGRARGGLVRGGGGAGAGRFGGNQTGFRRPLPGAQRGGFRGAFRGGAGGMGRFDGSGPRGAGGPGMGQNIEMLMTNQPSVGSGYNQLGNFNRGTSGSSYGNQGGFGQSGTYGSPSLGFGGQNSGFSSGAGSFGSRAGGYGDQSGFGGNVRSNQFKRPGDVEGYGGGGKRNTGFYNQNRW